MRSVPRIQERIARSVVYLVGSRAIMQLFGIVSGLLVARWLHPEDYGVMALAGAATIVVTILGEFGVGAVVIQFRDLDAAELNAAFWGTVLLSTILYTGLYAIAPVLAAYFASPMLTPVLRVVGVGAVLGVVRVVPDNLIRRRINLDRVSVVDMVATALNTPLVLGLAWAGTGVWALVTGTLFGTFVQCVLTFRLAGWRPGFRMGSARVKRLMSFSWAALGSKAAWSVYNQSDRVILGRIGGDAVLGFYALATQLALLPVEKIAAVVNQVSTPVFAEAQADRRAMGRYLLASVRIVAWIVLPISFGLMAFAGPSVPLLLTPKWTPIVPVVQLLCLYAAIRSLAVLFPPVLMAAYRADIMLRYNTVLLVVLPLAFGAGAWWNGAVGVAAVWAMLYPLPALWVVNRVLRQLGIPWTALGRHLWVPAASTAATVISALLVHGLMPDSLIGLFTAILSGALVHGLVFVVFGGGARGDIRELIVSVRRPHRHVAVQVPGQ